MSATAHAAHRYRRLFARLRHPVKGVEHEAQHLRQVEAEGSAGETPFIAILGVILFLGPIFLVMLGLALLAYYVIA
jgi:hypothetical protein